LQMKDGQELPYHSEKKHTYFSIFGSNSRYPDNLSNFRASCAEIRAFARALG